MIWLGWVGFYVISTIVGYLMWNPDYMYIFNIYDFKHILLITFLNKSELIFLHTVKWFQVLLYICNNLASVIFFCISFVSD